MNTVIPPHPAIPRTALLLFALILLTVCATAQGEEEHGVWFQRGDWEIVCDNTLTCRMAGYGVGERGYVSVLITRAAGPNAPLEGKVGLSGYLMMEPPVLTLQINGQLEGDLYRPQSRFDGLVFSLTSAQIHTLLAAARKDDVIEFIGYIESYDEERATTVQEKKSLILSGMGVSAVLLKADEVQGRIGTPGALIRKGKKPEKGVFPPRPMPVIQAAKVSDDPPRALTISETAILKPLLSRDCRAVSVDNVNGGYYPVDDGEVLLTPLDEHYAMLSMDCWSGDMELISGYWIIDRALKESPKLVAPFDRYRKGVPQPELRGFHYDHGVISSESTPGYRDGGSNYWSSERWVWNGREFRLSFAGHPARYFRDQTNIWYEFPIFEAKVVNADGTPRRSEWDSK